MDTTVTATVKRKHPLAECESCPLYSKPCAPTTGPSDAKTIFVSRSPGKYEAQKGVPFSGPSGQVLDYLLKQNGVSRNEILLTNVVLCASDEKVPPAAIKACAPRLRRDLENRDTIIAAGSEAVALILGTGGIDRYRGYRNQRTDNAGNHQTVVATNNPALVLRDDSTFPDLVKDFKLAFDPKPTPELPNVQWTNDVREATQWLRDYFPNDRGQTVSCDIESRGLSHDARIVAFGFTAASDCGFSFGEQVVSDKSFLRDTLRPALESKEVSYLWHNGKFDTRVLRWHGINARVDHDVMLLSYVLDERPGVHSLDYLLMDELAWPNYTPDIVREFKKNSDKRDADGEWKMAVPDELYPYNALDTAGAMSVYEVLWPRVQAEPGLLRAYTEILIPACDMLVDAELHGIPYDTLKAAQLYEEVFFPELEKLKEQLRTISGIPIYNPRSTTQNAALFYDRWNITHAQQRRPGKKRSVDEAARIEIMEGRYAIAEDNLPRKTDIALAKRAVIDSFVPKLDRHSKLTKQVGTYIVGLTKHAEKDPESRIRTSFKLMTSTGRLSSEAPNLQNITRGGKEDLPNIRTLFHAGPGNALVSADYSQAELRCIAVFTEEPTLSRAYRENLDIHNIAAERFYGPNYTKEQRSRAKNMNFGVAYRQGAATFQEKHGIPTDEAAKFIEWWYTEFSGVADWQKEIEKEVRERGYVESPFGRRRRFYLLTKENIQAAFREAINFQPQSTASDLTLCAGLVIHSEVDPRRATIVIDGHDSLVAEVAESYVDEYRVIVKQVMEAQPKDRLGWTLPFVADVSVGQNWGETA